MRYTICLVATLAACRTQSPAPEPTSSASIAAELVDSGCVVDSSTLIASIQAYEASDAAPAWLQCLESGRSVVSCSVPCSGSQ